jgi:predicted ATPase
MLTHVHFTGIQSLADVSLDLSPFTVLVGPNGCGKSTLLNEIGRLCEFTQAAVPHAKSSYGVVGEKFDQEHPAVRATLNGEHAQIWEGRDDRGAMFRLKVDHSSVPKHWADQTVIVAKSHSGSQAALPSGEKNAATNFQSLLRAHFGWRSQRLALVPSGISRPSETTATELNPNGYGLATILKDMAGDHTDAYLQLQVDLQTVVPHFRRLTFGKDQRPNPEGSGFTPLHSLKLVMSQGELPAHRVSDGTLLALALLTAVHNPGMPNLILMDDIDHGLHLGAQLKLLQAIRTAQKRRPDLQILCTTHSPYFMHDVAVEEVRVMALDNNGHTHVRPLADHPEAAAFRTAMTAGELWANLGEEWVVGNG